MTEKSTTVMFDFGDYSNALVGAPPDGFQAKILAATRLCMLAEQSGIEVNEDVFLIAALAAYMENDTNPLGLIQRAKQVVKWLEGINSPPTDVSSLALLENKANELARMVSRGLFRTEGFVLLVFDLGTEKDPGHLVHMATISRRDQIKLLTEHVAKLSAVQDEFD